MSKTYSFSGIPILNIQKLIGSIIPGLEKVLSVYYCSENNCLRAMVTNNTNENNLEEIIISDFSFFEELRKKRNPFSWHNKDELPFHIPRSGDKQIDMFTFRDVVLLIRSLNVNDNLHDLLFLYFKEKANYLGLWKDNTSLDLENKTIIGNLLYNTINTILKKNNEDKAVFRENQYVMQSILKRANIHRKEHYETQEKYEKSIVSLFGKYLLEISREKGIDFNLSEGAIKEIKKYSGDISNLKQIVENATFEAEIANMEKSPGQIKIDECLIDINFEETYPVVEENSTIHLEDKYFKTRALLDKLEGAVAKLIKDNINITGNNVGRACPVSISAPAISDALRKHSKKIIKLMYDHPDEWPLLRTEFRPLQNILVLKSSKGA